MKAGELIAKLRQFDAGSDVVCYSEDESIRQSGRLFTLLEVSGVGATEAEKTRGDDGVPSLIFGNSDASKPHVILEVTTEF